jgi:phage-related baseplate assembly protein
MSSTRLIDLASLPRPQSIEEISFEQIYAELKADFQLRAPEYSDFLESDPVVKLLQTFAYREVMLRQRENNHARSLLIAFATGGDLDHIGATYYNGTARLVITPADSASTPPVVAVMESDDDYRRRLLLQPEGQSVAGPRDAYRYHTLSADGSIKDASVTRPEPGTTEIFLLTRSGEQASAALCAKVMAAVSADDKRPHCEEVIVSPAMVVNYVIDVDITLSTGPVSEIVLAAAKQSLVNYATEKFTLGQGIYLSAIDAAAHVAGVEKITIKSPATEIVCPPSAAPLCTAVNVQIAGNYA